MGWLLFILIICCIAYSGVVINDYNSFAEEIQPGIERLEEKAEELKLLIRAKIAEVKEATGQLSDVKRLQAELQREITIVETALKKERAEGARLEMDKYKQDYKRTRDV